MSDNYRPLTPDEIAAHPLYSKADKFLEVLQEMPLENQMFGSIYKQQEDNIRFAMEVGKKNQEEKERQHKWQEDMLEVAKNAANATTENVEKFIIDELCNVLTHFEQRVVELEKRGEVEISNDIYSVIRRTLEMNGITSERETTIGRAKKELGETDFYFYRYIDGQREDVAILENKLIKDFAQQYKQLLGYLNPNFTFGITLSINKDCTHEEALQFIVNNLTDELYCIETTYGAFQITETSKRSMPPYYITTKHILPELHNREMKIYHLVLNLFDPSRKDVAIQARPKSKSIAKE